MSEAYSYPLNNQHAGPFDNSKDPITGLAYGTDGVELSPDDDKEALRGIPIFTPTMEEFKVSRSGYQVDGADSTGF